MSSLRESSSNVPLSSSTSDGATIALNLSSVVNAPTFPRKPDTVLFLNTTGKLVASAFHPVFPWVVAFDRSGTIHLADYSQQAPVMQFSIKALDEKLARQADLGRKLEADPDFQGTKQAEYARQDRSGAFFHIQFYDEYVFRSKVEAEIGKDETASIRFKQLPTWIVLVSENRIMMIDYKSLEVQEVRASSLELKGISTFDASCVLNRHHFVIGGVDGCIRVYDYIQQRIAKRLNGNSKTVTALATLQNTGVSHLLSAYSDGAMIMWNVEKEAQMLAFPKNFLHENSGITQISYDPIYRQVVTVSSDRTMASWDITWPIPANTSYTNISRYRLNAKRSFTSWQHYVHPALSHGTFIGWEKPAKIFTANSNEKTPVDLADLTQLIVIPGKKIKMYHMSIHPSFPCLISCATNQGLLVLGFETESTPTIAVRLDEAESVSVLHCDRQNISYAKIDQQHAHRKRDILGSQSKIMPASHTSYPQLAISHEYKYMSNLWWSTREYKIFNIKTSPPKLVDEGCAMSIVWSSRTDSYAVLIPNNVVAKNRKASVITPAAANPNMVLLRILDENTIKTTIALALPGNPIMVSGGPLLAVGCEVVSPSTGQLESLLTFFSWEGTKKLTETELPAPTSLVWDPTNTLCLLIYPTYVAVFETTPIFKLMCKASLVATSAIWYHKTLFIMTPDGIICAFPSLKNLEWIVLASSSARLIEKPSATATHNGDVVQVPRPPGPITPIGIMGEYLFVVDRYAMVHAISLGFPVLKAKIMSQAGHNQDALLWASRSQQECHDNIAAFLDTRGASDLALRLPGLSSWTRFHLRVRSNLLTDALESLRSLSLIAEKELGETLLDEPMDYWATPSNLNYGHILNRCYFLAMHSERLYQLKGIDAAINFGVDALKIASSIEPKMNMELIGYLHRNDRVNELTHLRDELLQNGLFEFCKLAAFALGDQKTVLQCLVQEEKYSLAGAHASKHHPTLVAQLEAKLREQLKI